MFNVWRVSWQQQSWPRISNNVKRYWIIMYLPSLIQFHPGSGRLVDGLVARPRRHISVGEGVGPQTRDAIEGQSNTLHTLWEMFKKSWIYFACTTIARLSICYARFYCIIVFNRTECSVSYAECKHCECDNSFQQCVPCRFEAVRSRSSTPSLVSSA